jgi:hypothetical protein
MQRAITSFRGEAPRVTSRALPDNAAQDATNAKLLTGDLCAWKQFAVEFGLANPATVQTIFLLNGAWLSWSADVDVARGTVSGDTTFRTYLTAPGFYNEPRFTNFALATTGAQPYPVATRPLGVPAPSTAPSTSVGVGSAPTTSVTDSGDQLETAWVFSPPVDTGPGFAEVTQSAVVGNPAPSYWIRCQDNIFDGAYAYRDFGVAGYTVVTMQTDVAFIEDGGTGAVEASWRVVCSAAGSGAVVKVSPLLALGNPFLLIGNSSEWGASESWLVQEEITTPLDGSGATWYTMVITATINDSGTTTIVAQLKDGATVIQTATVTSLLTTGGYCGVEGRTGYLFEVSAYYDNFLVQGSGSNSVITTTATSYVYTFVNDLDQESAPSPASSTVLRPDGVTVTVTTPTAVPSGISSDYGIALKRIYRATTGNLGTEFRFVAEVALATADYDDVLTDAELGEVLPSELWDLPPEDLEGILALPNGVMAGFSKNQLCLSAQNFPHAWPVAYRLNTDTDIVGIGNIDTTVVIGTESFVYVAAGNDPANYSMSKSEVPYACSSKNSFAYLTNIGVVFAGPDGLMAVAGIGQIRNLTDTVFTRDQWQALNPSTMVGVAHNDIYWLFWESGSNRGCYAIDMKATGFGVVEMAFHCSAAHVDPVQDKLYLVLDYDNEPDDEMLPVRADPPTYVDGRTIYEFEGNPSVLMNYRYRGKLWLLEHPAWFSIFQVRADDYDNLLLRIYGDGVQVEEVVVTEDTEFTVTCVDQYKTLEYEVLGSSTVRIIQGAEDVSELG